MHTHMHAHTHSSYTHNVINGGWTNNTLTEAIQVHSLLAVRQVTANEQSISLSYGI